MGTPGRAQGSPLAVSGHWTELAACKGSILLGSSLLALAVPFIRVNCGVGAFTGGPFVLVSLGHQAPRGLGQILVEPGKVCGAPGGSWMLQSQGRAEATPGAGEVAKG